MHGVRIGALLSLDPSVESRPYPNKTLKLVEAKDETRFLTLDTENSVYQGAYLGYAGLGPGAGSLTLVLDKLDLAFGFSSLGVDRHEITLHPD